MKRLYYVAISMDEVADGSLRVSDGDFKLASAA